MSSIIPVFIPHSGCKNDCVFCNQKRIAGHIRAPGISEVTEIIASSLGFSGSRAPEVAFYGGSFTAIGEELMRAYLGAAQEFVAAGAVCGIRLSTRPDCIDERVLRILSEYGVRTIELGAQSMCDRVLLESGRGHTSEDTRRASSLIKRCGFELILQMMMGLPGSSAAEDEKTAREIAGLSPSGVRIYPVVVIRETELERMWRAGAYTPLTPDEAAERGASILDIFAAAEIPVIRFGLNPTEDLSGGDAVAGAYHPALGELAQTARYRRLLERELAKTAPTENMTLFVSPSRVSAAVGHRGKNREMLMKKYGIKALKVRGDAALKDGEVRVAAAV